MHRVAAPFTTLSRWSLMLLIQLIPSHPIYMVGHTALVVWQSHLIPMPSLHGGEGSSPGLVPSDDTFNSESAMGIKPCDSGMVIDYQVDKFTQTWSAEHCVAHSHICPGFTGKVSSFTHFSPSQIRLLQTLTRLGFHPHWYPWDTRIGNILGWASCHCFISLFWVSLLS